MFDMILYFLLWAKCGFMGLGKCCILFLFIFTQQAKFFFFFGIMIVYFLDGIEKNEPRVLWFYVVFYTF